MSRLFILLILLLLLSCCDAYKILVAVPKWRMYSSKQVMTSRCFLPVVLPELRGNGTKKARVILTETAEGVADLMAAAQKDGAVAKIWSHSANSVAGIHWSTNMLSRVSYLNAKKILKDQKLIESLKAEKFDIGITELFDFSCLALFHVIGLDNVVGAHTTSVFEGTLLSAGAPVLPSFVPGSQTYTDDSTSLKSRLINMFMTYQSYKFHEQLLTDTQKAIDEVYGKKSFDLWERVRDITWFLVNSDPLFDFPKPLPVNIIEIAGISVTAPKPVDEKWGEILNRRKKNVLVSFGSLASTLTMPPAMKNAITRALASFKDTTFIWKNDDANEKLAEDVENIVVTQWMPQNDLLGDKRITMFLTHGGAGSLLESALKGVPLMVVPCFGDQMRNAQIAKRHGMAVVYDKLDLVDEKKLTAALSEVLYNNKYKKAAELTSQILKSHPMGPREKLVHTVEMAGRFGKMPRWQSSSRNLNLLQYFCLDVFIYGFLALGGIAFFFFWGLRRYFFEQPFKSKSE
ncbi:unnamed protein product [Caenorhabditis auriculariae]|uniref:glucuronosyltransferase n=1 Tax=Caenorhabditis auriculariae TaxID=2777116 RepID=A0A8S1H6N8_9PELO|nr:unnamed protein product [Caenorhabditis auriculariae]